MARDLPMASRVDAAPLPNEKNLDIFAFLLSLERMV
jgi:hypothetical protein